MTEFGDELDAPETKRLVRWLAAPSTDEELRGEEAAVAAFRAAMATTPTAATAVPKPRRRLIGRPTVAFVSALAGAAVAVIAVGAGTGVLPSPFHPERQQPVASTGTSIVTSHPAATSTRTEPSTAVTTTPSVGLTATPAGTPTPGQALLGRCETYLKEKPKNRDKAVAQGKFDDLVAAAGGADKVLAYCTALVGPTTTPTS